MAAIPISEAPQRALNRLQEVLASSLFTDVLEQRETADYPLPAPETWAQCRVNLSRHWQSLNVQSTLGVIHGESTTNHTNYSGDGSQYSRTQQTPYTVGVIIKADGGFPTVTTQGREMIDDEWMQRRVELYRGALIDTICMWAPESTSIHEIMLSNNSANLFEIPEIGRFAHASVTFNVHQEVLIKSPAL